jgi:site-specific DNA-methyltransferase (cytosine-N4-specific)
VDIFSGSNATGWSAETEKRFWISIDTEAEYVATSAFRFLKKGTSVESLREVYESINSGNSVDLNEYTATGKLL